MNKLVISYQVLDIRDGDDWRTICRESEVFTEEIIDPFGSVFTNYTIVYCDPIDYNYRTHLCYSYDHSEYGYPKDGNITPSSIAKHVVADKSYVVYFFKPNSLFSNLQVDTFFMTLLDERNISGVGGINIASLANYDDRTLGVWFAKVDIVSWDRALIPADFLYPQVKFDFGHFVLNYHDSSVEILPFNFRHTYLGLYQWFQSIEPKGIVSPTSVWVPVPFYPRASGLSWGLRESVVAHLKVWAAQLVVGFDAYF